MLQIMKTEEAASYEAALAQLGEGTTLQQVNTVTPGGLQGRAAWAACRIYSSGALAHQHQHPSGLLLLSWPAASHSFSECLS